MLSFSQKLKYHFNKTWYRGSRLLSRVMFVLFCFKKNQNIFFFESLGLLRIFQGKPRICRPLLHYSNRAFFHLFGGILKVNLIFFRIFFKFGHSFSKIWSRGTLEQTNQSYFQGFCHFFFSNMVKWSP